VAIPQLAVAKRHVALVRRHVAAAEEAAADQGLKMGQSQGCWQISTAEGQPVPLLLRPEGSFLLAAALTVVLSHVQDKAP